MTLFSNSRRRKSRGQQGYGLLLVIFCMTLILLATMAAAPRILVQRRREREKEMIWRGQQYVRAITMYRRKTGRFPTSLDDLVKGQPGIRFLRKQYSDPMNQNDGSWRLIYLSPSGQLIGSLTTASALPQWNTAVLLSNKSAQPTTSGNVSPGTPGTPFGQTGDQSQPGATTPAAGSNNSQATSQVDSNGDSPAVVGGNIVGVASKIDRESVIYYKKEHNYRRFEFIWDAAKEMGVGIVDQQLVPPTKAPDPISPGTEPPPPSRPPN